LHEDLGFTPTSSVLDPKHLKCMSINNAAVIVKNNARIVVVYRMFQNINPTQLLIYE
jgi:hypothetical protein